MTEKWLNQSRLAEPVNVRLYERQINELQEISYKFGLPVSQAIRDLIDDGLSRYKNTTEKTRTG
jgi:hypothetical protein